MLQALNLPKKVYFKPGCMPVALRELGDIYRCQRALLVTDPELYRAGIAAPVADRLRKQEIRVAEFSPSESGYPLGTSAAHCLS